MAKSPRGSAAKGKPVHSSTTKPRRVKVSSDSKSSASQEAPAVVPCLCPERQGDPSGTIYVNEDGTLMPVFPPNYAATLAFDPNRPAGLPYWKRDVPVQNPDDAPSGEQQ